MGLEAAAWLDHDDRWQPIPSHPLIVIWFCEKNAQFEILRPQLEEFCLTRGWSWNENKHRYEWPNGDRMYVTSYEADWRSYQGIPADLICFDEEPPRSLWREMQMRRRGKRDTRYIIAATATTPGSWMETEIYRPWLDHHLNQGLDEQGAIDSNNHPSIWCLSYGGIDDNPWVTQEQREHFHRTIWSSEKEKRVRLFGGFSDWIGDAVFDDSSIAWLRERAKDAPGDRQGSWAWKYDIDEQLLPPVEWWPRRGEPEPVDDRTHPALSTPLSDLKHRIRFFLDQVPERDGRISIYEEPDPEHLYVIGADFGYGLHNRDYDTAIVLDKSVTPHRQVCEMHGHWGERFDRLLYACAHYYGEAFIVGERQVGLSVLRRLLDELDYNWLYYDRDEASRSRRLADKLGHHRTRDDITLRNLRRAIIQRELTLASETTIDQMSRLQWWHPTEQEGQEERRADEDLKIKLPGGGSPDLVMALCYAVHGLSEVVKFPKPASRRFPKGSKEDLAGHNEPIEEEEKAQRFQASFLSQRFRKKQR